MSKFNIIFQQFMYNNDTTQNKKQYRSLQQFKHFCDNLGLIAKDLKEEQDSKFITVNLFRLENGNQIRFEFYNKYNPHFYNQNKYIIDSLSDFKEKYIITLDGNQNSKVIFFS